MSLPPSLPQRGPVSGHNRPVQHRRRVRRSRLAVLLSPLLLATLSTGAARLPLGPAPDGTESLVQVRAADAPVFVPERPAPRVKRASRSRTRPVPTPRPTRSPDPVPERRRTALQAPRSAGECSGAGWRERRVSQALSGLRGDAVGWSGYRISVEAGRRGYLGLTTGSRIQLFVRSCDAESDSLLRHVTAHEIGHAFDASQMSASRRADWLSARDIDPSTPWYGCGGCTDFATPAGDFAEVFAQWARGSGPNRSRMAPPPGPAELARLADAFFGA